VVGLTVVANATVRVSISGSWQSDHDRPRAIQSSTGWQWWPGTNYATISSHWRHSCEHSAHQRTLSLWTGASLSHHSLLL